MFGLAEEMFLQQVSVKKKEEKRREEREGRGGEGGEERRGEGRGGEERRGEEKRRGGDSVSESFSQDTCNLVQCNTRERKQQRK